MIGIDRVVRPISLEVLQCRFQMVAMQSRKPRRARWVRPLEKLVLTVVVYCSGKTASVEPARQGKIWMYLDASFASKAKRNQI